MMLDWSNTKSWCEAGIPIRSHTIRSGRRAATSVTKSHSPRSQTSSTIIEAWSCTESSSRASIRGVNPADTSRLSRAWRGSSMAMMELKYSLNSGGKSLMVTPRAEE